MVLGKALGLCKNEKNETVLEIAKAIITFGDDFVVGTASYLQTMLAVASMLCNRLF